MAATVQQTYVIGKCRVAAQRLGTTYNLLKALQAQASAEGWPAMFGSTNTVLDDGTVSDGRIPITDTDITNLIAIVGTFITYMEQAGAANRNTVLKIALNPEQF